MSKPPFLYRRGVLVLGSLVVMALCLIYSGPTSRYKHTSGLSGSSSVSWWVLNSCLPMGGHYTRNRKTLLSDLSMTRSSSATPPTNSCYKGITLVEDGE